MKINIINVSSPTFFVKRDDPTNVSYSDEHQNLDIWKFVQTAWYGFNPKLRKHDFLYIYEKEKEVNGFRGVILTPLHLKV